VATGSDSRRTGTKALLRIGGPHSNDGARRGDQGTRGGDRQHALQQIDRTAHRPPQVQARRKKRGTRKKAVLLRERSRVRRRETRRRDRRARRLPQCRQVDTSERADQRRQRSRLLRVHDARREPRDAPVPRREHPVARRARPHRGGRRRPRRRTGGALGRPDRRPRRLRPLGVRDRPVRAPLRRTLQERYPGRPGTATGHRPQEGERRHLRQRERRPRPGRGDHHQHPPRTRLRERRRDHRRAGRPRPPHRRHPGQPRLRPLAGDGQQGRPHRPRLPGDGQREPPRARHRPRGGNLHQRRGRPRSGRTPGDDLGGTGTHPDLHGQARTGGRLRGAADPLFGCDGRGRLRETRRTTNSPTRTNCVS